MGSQSVTCHLTQQAGTCLTYSGGMESWVDLRVWLYTKMVYRSADISHPSR